MDQELSDAAAYALVWRCMCTQKIAALFCVKWRHGRQCDIKSKVKLCLYAYLLVKHSSQISSQSNLTRPSFSLFWRASPNKKKNRTSSDMGSVPDPKMHFSTDKHSI